MTSRWKIQPVQDDGRTPRLTGFLGVRGKTQIFGETIADVMDTIAWHEGEQP